MQLLYINTINRQCMQLKMTHLYQTCTYTRLPTHTYIESKKNIPPESLCSDVLNPRNAQVSDFDNVCIPWKERCTQVLGRIIF